jgi:hypothetical protein
MVRVTSPSVAGAVQVVVAAETSEKVPTDGLVDHAKLSESPVSASWAVTVAFAVAPGVTFVEETSSESITGTEFLNGVEDMACCAVISTVVV